jgi:hypothetical protein
LVEFHFISFIIFERNFYLLIIKTKNFHSFFKEIF